MVDFCVYTDFPFWLLAVVDKGLITPILLQWNVSSVCQQHHCLMMKLFVGTQQVSCEKQRQQQQELHSSVCARLGQTPIHCHLSTANLHQHKNLHLTMWLTMRRLSQKTFQQSTIFQLSGHKPPRNEELQRNFQGDSKAGRGASHQRPIWHNLLCADPSPEAGKCIRDTPTNWTA